MYSKEVGLIKLDQRHRDIGRHIEDLQLSSGCEYILSYVFKRGGAHELGSMRHRVTVIFNFHLGASI